MPKDKNVKFLTKQNLDMRGKGLVMKAVLAATCIRGLTLFLVMSHEKKYFKNNVRQN